MIPTWSDHAHEAARCVRESTGKFVVSKMRYVAGLSATIRTITRPKPRSTP